MDIRVSAQSSVPIYQQIVEQVKHSVASGRLKPGDELPTIRALAQRLLVNPNTVARAYRELEVEGLVNSRVGQGTTVASGVSPLAYEARLRLMAEHVSVLVTHARHLGFSLDEVCGLVKADFDAAATPQKGA